MVNTPSTLFEILAKSRPQQQTLVEHSREAIEHLLSFLNTFAGPVERAARAVGISQEELVSRLFAAVWLHDIGKASRDFQARISGKSSTVGIYHPLLSTPFALAAVPPIGSIPYEAAAVMSHHSPYWGGLYGDIETNLRPSYIWDATWQFYQMLPVEHRRVLGYDFPFPLPEPTLWDSRRLIGLIRDAVSGYLSPKRDVFGLFLAAIHYSDWLASGHQNSWTYSVPDLTEQVQFLLQKYKDAPQKTFASRVAPGIQSRSAAAKGHLLLIAPTGSGKTEAALLWAANQAPVRLVYLLPTRVTSNAMYERVQGYVGELAGLAHGTAGLIIGEKEGYDSEAFQSRLYHSTFMQPVTVATVDQLLLAKFNWNQWGLVETNAAQSAIIVDEIHAYDLYTLGLILNASRELAGRGARLCFMSATMPDFVKEALLCLLEPFGGHTLVDCPEAEGEQRHALFVRSEPLANALPDIEALFRQKKQKVLVVVNTVDSACDMYRLVRDRIGRENAMLFHGRFIERDRRKLEKRIISENEKDDGFVAVVTQIVEVSLDIDYDVMFTQVAPVDALVQRFGRVNRKGRKGLAPVFIFQADKGSSKVYGEDTLADAWNLLRVVEPGSSIRQADVLKWVRTQYPKEKWLQAALEATREAEQNVRSIRRKLWQIQTLRFSDETKALWDLAQSRREQFPSFEVVPECFRHEVERCKHPVERQNYVVRVPAYLIQHKAYEPELGVLFAAVDYDAEFGVKRSQKD